MTTDWIGVIGIAATLLTGLAGVLVPLLRQGRGIETRLHAGIKTAVRESETRMRAENREAHEAIGENIKGVEERLGTRLDRIETRERRRALLLLDE